MVFYLPLMSNGEAMVNVVRFSNGKREASIRITKHADDRIEAHVCMSIAWKKIGGLKAAENEQKRLEAKGYRVVAAA
jgi:hypothetical protein